MVRAISLSIASETTGPDQTVIAAIIWDIVYSVSNAITSSDEDNNLFDYLGVDGKFKNGMSQRQIDNRLWLINAIWETFTEVLMEQGIYQDTQTMKFIRNTFLKAHSLQPKLAEVPVDEDSATRMYQKLVIEADLLQIVSLQIKSVDPSIAKARFRIFISDWFKVG